MGQPHDCRDRDEECRDEALQGAISAGEVTIVLAPHTTGREHRAGGGGRRRPPLAMIERGLARDWRVLGNSESASCGLISAQSIG